MGSLPLAATLLFQDAVSTANDVHIIMICEVVLTAIVVVLLLALAIGGLVIYSKVNKLVKAADAKAQPLIAQAAPLIGKTREIAGHVNEIVGDLKPKIAAVSSDLQPKIAAVTSDLQPKIAQISGDVQHIANLFRSKVDEAGHTLTSLNQTVQGYNQTAQDVNQKAKGQVARVNEMVSDALTTTQHVSQQIQHGIRVPIEKVASWVTAARLGIENLAEKLPFLSPEPAYKPGTNPPRGNAHTPGVPYTSNGPRIVHSATDAERTSGFDPDAPAPRKS
jgi:methyl-accepting chemotaxis protein